MSSASNTTGCVQGCSKCVSYISPQGSKTFSCSDESSMETSILGVCIAISVLVIIIISILIFVYLRRRKRKEKITEEDLKREENQNEENCGNKMMSSNERKNFHENINIQTFKNSKEFEELYAVPKLFKNEECGNSVVATHPSEIILSSENNKRNVKERSMLESNNSKNKSTSPSIMRESQYEHQFDSNNTSHKKLSSRESMHCEDSTFSQVKEIIIRTCKKEKRRRVTKPPPKPRTINWKAIITPDNPEIVCKENNVKKCDSIVVENLVGKEKCEM